MKRSLRYLLSYFLGTITYLVGLNLAMFGYIRSTNQDINYLLIFALIWWPIIVILWILKNRKVNWFTAPFLSAFPLLAIALSLFAFLSIVFNDISWQTIEFPGKNLQIYTNGSIIADPMCNSFVLRQDKEILPNVLFVKYFSLGEYKERGNCSYFSYQIPNSNEIIIESNSKDIDKQGEEFRFYLKDNVYY